MFEHILGPLLSIMLTIECVDGMIEKKTGDVAPTSFKHVPLHGDRSFDPHHTTHPSNIGVRSRKSDRNNAPHA
jgi:hypothetical protein